MERTEIKKALSHSEFFEALVGAELEKIVDLCQTATYQVGEQVFRQGDLGEHLYIIVDGQVYLERSVDMGARKGKVVIEALGKNRVLGCWSTLLDESHILMSSATCQRPTQMVVIKGAELRKLMMTNTSLGLHVFEKLCFLLRDRVQAAYGALEKI